MTKNKIIPEEEVKDKKEIQVNPPEKSQCDNDYMGDKLGLQMWSDITSCCYPNIEVYQSYGVIAETMKNIKPRDHVEKMLAAQMLTTHNTAMKCFQRATSCFKSSQTPTLEMGNTILNSATKLIRTYTMQMEALNRYRSKGKQKMTVEHVHINAGGQAIIGNINQEKKSTKKLKHK